MKIHYLEPNHICQNPNCTKGPNGTVKHYYACDYCGWTENWRSICCSRECYIEFNRERQEQVKAHKSVPKRKPKRTDMTEAEVDAMLQKSADEVIAKTMDELSDYQDMINEQGLANTIDFVNEEIDQRECHNG